MESSAVRTPPSFSNHCSAISPGSCWWSRAAPTSTTVSRSWRRSPAATGASGWSASQPMCRAQSGRIPLDAPQATPDRQSTRRACLGAEPACPRCAAPPDADHPGLLEIDKSLPPASAYSATINHLLPTPVGCLATMGPSVCLKCNDPPKPDHRLGAAGSMDRTSAGASVRRQSSKTTELAGLRFLNWCAQFDCRCFFQTQ